MLMKVGYEPRRAYQMANKISGLGENIGEFIPGVSYELSQERGESPVNMALLDMLPGALVARKLAQKAMRKDTMAALHHFSGGRFSVYL